NQRGPNSFDGRFALRSIVQLERVCDPRFRVVRWFLRRLFYIDSNWLAHLGGTFLGERLDSLASIRRGRSRFGGSDECLFFRKQRPSTLWRKRLGNTNLCLPRR